MWARTCAKDASLGIRLLSGVVDWTQRENGIHKMRLKVTSGKVQRRGNQVQQPASTAAYQEKCNKPEMVVVMVLQPGYWQPGMHQGHGKGEGAPSVDSVHVGHVALHRWLEAQSGGRPAVWSMEGQLGPFAPLRSFRGCRQNPWGMSKRHLYQWLLESWEQAYG